jgi:glucose/arabinose dehydrogenase/mono/diheme cytochrome c family protein
MHQFGRVSLLVWSLCLLLAGCQARQPLPAPAAPAPPANASTPPPYLCRFTEEPVTIDGLLDEPAWRDAAEVGPFTLPWLGANARPALKATRAKMLWDREHVYVAADMDDGDLYADVVEHDGPTWNNDVFEVFLKPTADKPAYYELQVNAANTQFDCFFPRRGHLDRFRRLHDFGMQSTVKRRGSLDDWTDRDEGWTVELRIPWTSFMHTGGRPEPGDEWRFALCRYDYDVSSEGPELSTCAALSRLDFHRHEDYRPVVFQGPRGSTAGPVGIPRIVPVTTSKVAGSPEPPLPYTVERVHPRARIPGPIAVAHQPGSDRLIYVTEPAAYRPSAVMRMRDDEGSHEPELLVPADDTTVHYAITFHPRFADNGFVYIGSNGRKSPDGRIPAGDPATTRFTRVTRYVIDRAPPYAFHPESAAVIIEWNSNGHNGGDIAFGPDGMMYVGSGDGSIDSDTDRVGQDLTTLRSKILRIDPDHPDEDVPADGRHYSVPRDNPIFDAGSPIATVPGARPETWAYGLRQPWRLAFDPVQGRLWVGNQGQDLWEQIYLIERGANYGWSILEGTHPFHRDQPAGPTPFSRPVAEHPHAEARAMTGGLVVTGSALPGLAGAYVYGDFATGRIWGLRHDGTRVTWHELIADTGLNITGFGTDSQGRILICDHRPGTEGGFHRLVPAPAAANDRPPFPRRLSESGLFADIPRHRLVAGAVPYEPAAQLWSDGTHKARFIVLPPVRDGAETVPAKIGVSNARGWNFPDGTVLVKSFAVERIEGDPASRRWIETRFMLKEQGEWAGYSYEWLDDQTDAVLVDAAGGDREYTIRPREPDAGDTQRQWHYPARAECMLCHSRASNYVLGLCTVQLNRDFDYGAVLGPGHATDNQLRALERLGLLEVNWWGDALAAVSTRAEAAGIPAADRGGWIARQLASADPDRARFGARKSALLSRSPAATNRLVDPHDASEPVAARARSYLHANCASCHVGSGGGNAAIELEYLSAHETIPLEAMRVVDAKPLHAAFELPDARIVAPGEPRRSLLLERMHRRGPGQMPPLATAVVDERGVAVVREWIRSLAPGENATTGGVAAPADVADQRGLGR